MTPETNMQFPIPNAVLEPYIKSAVATAIAASLGDGAKLVEAVVQRALTDKVDENGNRNTSDYYNKHLLVDIVSRKAIQEIARETIRGLAEEMRPKIKEQVEKHIKTQSSKLAQALVDGLIGSLKTSWSVTVKIDD